MTDYDQKIKVFMKDQLLDLRNIKILEFGVERGRSTKIFLDLCKNNNGELYSVDIKDCSQLFKDTKWNFIKSRDDNFDYVKNKIPKEFDVIYLDTIHEANHVEKIFYNYFDLLKIGGEFYIDDISWLPYLKSKDRNSFYCEINNKETFQRLLDIYNNNLENFDIYFTFLSSGMCRIVKKKNELKKSYKITTREISLKNFLRKLLGKGI